MTPQTNQVEIIIPAYNEALRIKRTLIDYAQHFRERAHISVVLNGCRDNTLQVVRNVEVLHPGRIAIIEIPEAIGKGSAIVHGWRQALNRPDAPPQLGFVDADGATSAEEFEKLVAHMESHDGVIGSRFIDGATVVDRQSALRTIMSRYFIRLVRLLFQLPYHDTQCGAKLFTRAALGAVLEDLHTTDMVFDVDLLWKLHKRGFDIAEVPTFWVDQPGSASFGTSPKFVTQALRMFVSLLRLRFSHNGTRSAT